MISGKEIIRFKSDTKTKMEDLYKVNLGLSILCRLSFTTIVRVFMIWVTKFFKDYLIQNYENVAVAKIVHSLDAKNLTESRGFRC